MFTNPPSPLKVGIVGVGAIGGTVAKSLLEGVEGVDLIGLCDTHPVHVAGDIPYLPAEDLVEKADLVIEALPPDAVPELARLVFRAGKDLVLISSSAWLLYPEIEAQKRSVNSRIIVPSGALCGIDGVSAMSHIGIIKAQIRSTKKPAGYRDAPYIKAQGIDLNAITEKTQLFAGTALDAAQAFPANVNVAATLSLAGAGAENTHVEIWADPESQGNTHEISVESQYSRLSASISNLPDPANPKTSMLAAYSIVSCLKKIQAPMVIL